MEIVMRFLIISIPLMLLTGSCGIPREICHENVEKVELFRSRELLLTYFGLVATGRGTDAARLAGPAGTVCLVAEQERKNCKDELNIPWFGI